MVPAAPESGTISLFSLGQDKMADTQELDELVVTATEFLENILNKGSRWILFRVQKSQQEKELELLEEEEIEQ